MSVSRRGIDNHIPNLERMAKAICSVWPKTPDGCAVICMDRLGSLPDGCRYAKDVHGERARKILEELDKQFHSHG